MYALLLEVQWFATLYSTGQPHTENGEAAGAELAGTRKMRKSRKIAC